MTRERRHGADHSPFGEWMRTNPALDSRTNGLTVVDIDWCVHQYATHGSRAVQNFMFIEEKRYAEIVRPHQMDTIKTINRFFVPSGRAALSRRVESHMARGAVLVRFWGFHLLEFEKSGPEDSKWIRWNRAEVLPTMLEELLTFRRNPRSLEPRDERSHHGGAKQMPLFW